MSSIAPLRRMQALLARLYDAPVDHDVDDFLLTERDDLARVVGEEQARAASDEHVFLVEEGRGVRIGVFIDSRVLDRLARRDPLRDLDEDNLADYCTALEGVSHFHYLVWSLAHRRTVSLLELELQAEVDKYAMAVWLLSGQRSGSVSDVRGSLHARMFGAVSFLPHLDAGVRERYEEANRRAARYCQTLDRRYLHPRRFRPEGWLGELRRFFRCAHQEKLRQSMA